MSDIIHRYVLFRLLTRFIWMPIADDYGYVSDHHNSLHPILKAFLYSFFLIFSFGSKIWILWRSVYNQNASDKQHLRKKYWRDSSFLICLCFYVFKSLNDVYSLSLLLIIFLFFIANLANRCNLDLTSAVCICGVASLLKVTSYSWEKFHFQQTIHFVTFFLT